MAIVFEMLIDKLNYLPNLIGFIVGVKKIILIIRMILNKSKVRPPDFESVTQKVILVTSFTHL
jgi:hypothetical protein